MQSGDVPVEMKVTRVTTAASPPPRSALVEKLFQTRASMQRGPKAGKPDANQAAAAPTPAPPKAAPAYVPVEQDIVLKKLQELEEEISKFKFENAELAKLRQTKEEELKSFRAEVQEFSRQKAEEQESFRKFREEEVRKLKRERMLFETHVENVKSRPDKKQRDEIEDLKAEISRLREELADKERKHTLAVARHKDKAQELTQRNQELENEIQVLERQRLSEWPIDAKSQKAKVAGPPPEQPGQFTELCSSFSNSSVSSCCPSTNIRPSGKVPFGGCSCR
jgi:centromere protein J